MLKFKSAGSSADGSSTKHKSAKGVDGDELTSIASASTNKKKKQQLVKHKRKNWSKTDIADVEQGMEELRQEQLTGLVFISLSLSLHFF